MRRWILAKHRPHAPNLSLDVLSSRVKCLIGGCVRERLIWRHSATGAGHAPFLPTSTDPTKNIPQLTADSPIATSPFRHAEIGKKGTTGYAG